MEKHCASQPDGKAVYLDVISHVIYMTNDRDKEELLMAGHHCYEAFVKGKSGYSPLNSKSF